MLQRDRLIAAATFAITGLAVLWFAAVDSCWWIEDCPDCSRSLDVYQVRVCGFPIHEELQVWGLAEPDRTHFTPSDCDHPQLHRWMKHRYVGMLICCCPCINGIVRLGDGDPPARQLPPHEVRE